MIAIGKSFYAFGIVTGAQEELLCVIDTVDMSLRGADKTLHHWDKMLGGLKEKRDELIRCIQELVQSEVKGEPHFIQDVKENVYAQQQKFQADYRSCRARLQAMIGALPASPEEWKRSDLSGIMSWIMYVLPQTVEFARVSRELASVCIHQNKKEKAKTMRELDELLQDDIYVLFNDCCEYLDTMYDNCIRDMMNEFDPDAMSDLDVEPGESCSVSAGIPPSLVSYV